jgi:hypothetical protein
MLVPPSCTFSEPIGPRRTPPGQINHPVPAYVGIAIAIAIASAIAIAIDGGGGGDGSEALAWCAGGSATETPQTGTRNIAFGSLCLPGGNGDLQAYGQPP